MIRASALLASCLVATGCGTALKVTRVDPNDPKTFVGAPFSLMHTRYRVEVTRQIAGCGPNMTALMKAEVKVTESAPDPAQQFVLDTNGLAGWFKTSDVKLTYHPSGAVASLNATVEDHTAEVIANVAATVAKAVSISAAAGAPVGGAPAEACNAKTVDALAQIKKLKPGVNAATAVVDALTTDIKNLLAKVAAASGNADEATKKLLSQRYDSLVLANEDLKDKSIALDKALKAVTYTETLVWPPDGNTWAQVFALPDGVFMRWGNVDDDEKNRMQFAVTLALGGMGATGRADPPATPTTVQPNLGLPYRMPLAGRLDVCAGATCTASDAPLTRSDGAVLQLGSVYYFPCVSGPFTSVNCAFELTEDGLVKSMGSSQKAAPAVGATAALKDLATQAATAQDTCKPPAIPS